MTGFVQVIEWSTTRLEELKALQEEMRSSDGRTSGPNRIMVCSDRNQPGRFMTIVEFSSYEEAMKNSNDPATDAFAARMRELCDGPPVFHDLDVMEVAILTRSGMRSTAGAAG